MNTRVAAILAVITLVAALFVFRHYSAKEPAARPAPTAATPAPTKAKKPPPTPAPSASENPQAPPPELVFDDDPKGPLLLEGQVLDSADTPVADAQVTIDSNPRRTVKTESDGSFAIGELLPRSYTLTARHGDRVGGPVMHLLSDKSEPVAIRLVAGSRLTVTTTDGKGGPVAGATVRLRNNDEREATTDGEGRVRFAGVAGGTAVVAVRASGFGEVRRLTIIPEVADHNLAISIALRPGAPVAGRVIDDSGQPVAKARVSIRAAAELLAAGSARSDQALTDESGRFALPALSAGSYRLRAVHEKMAPAVSPPMVLDGVTARTDMEIVMKAGGALAGKVVDTGARPAPYALVRVREHSGDNFERGTGRVRQVTADERGEFHIGALPRAAATAIAVSDQASSEVVTVDFSDTAEHTDLTLVLSITGTIAGRVVDTDGEPVAEAQVTALPDFFKGSASAEFAMRGMAAATTDGGGAFALTGLAEGSYQLRASRSRVSTNSFMQSGVPAKTGDTDVELTLDRPGSIAGKLQFKDGTAPEAFTVAVAFPPGAPVSNKTGAFTVGDIPAGKYDVTFRGSGFVAHRVAAVEVQPGRATDMGNVEVTRGRHVSGQVVTESGSPVAGATVVVARQLIGDGKAAIIEGGSAIGESLGVITTTTDDDGSYFLNGIGPQPRLIIAESTGTDGNAPAGRSLPATIPAGRDDVTLEFVLRPFGGVSGQVTMGGKPAAGANIIAAPRTGGNQMLIVTAGEDGRYVYERLARGPHRLTASVSQGLFGGASSAAKEIEIVAEQVATVDLVIEVGDVTIQITVKGVDDAPIDIAQLFLIKGEHSPKNAKELTDTYLRDQAGGIHQGMAVGTTPTQLAQIIPGEYSLCVIPINGPIADASFQMRLQEHADKLKVYCQVAAIAESPKEQRITAVVPPMEPFTEGASETGDPASP